MTHCPKCDADISDSYEPDDWSVGIIGGYYCDACDLAVSDDHEPRDDDVAIGPPPRRADGKIGTPISELSGQPGPKDDIGHPDHARYANFCRIAKSWGFD
jgi:hypothetical protein